MGNIESHVLNDPSAHQAVRVMVEEYYKIIAGNNAASQMSREVLYSYLASVVPLTLKQERVNDVEKVVVDQQKWKALIEWPLGYFICGEDPDFGLRKIREMDDAPIFCGKVFEIGDPTYSCKDCAVDPTCVFCHDCFQRSAHTKHKYRMHASGGNGGCCDCGDIEAWKRDPACEKHAQSNDDGNEKDPTGSLAPGVLQRASFMYRELLQYCIDILLWLDNDNLPKELIRSSAKKKDSNYFCMLYNDEVHTYDDVIRTLEQVISCSKTEAIRYATIVDKEGRSLIYFGEKEACLKVSRYVKTRTSRDDRGPLKCEAIEGDIVAHQVATIELLSLLNEITDCSAGFRRLLCQFTLTVMPPRSESILDELLESDTSLWKVARGRCHRLFMNAVLADSYGRQEFAISFAKAYKVLMKDFIEDDHDHGISASSMSVQVFTVPTLARKLIEENDILEVVLMTFMEHVEEAITDEGHFDFQSGRNGRTISLKRESYILHDLGFLLLHKPERWSPQLRTSFLKAFSTFAQILRGMQGMEQVVRELITHIEYEPNWETGFLMQLWMMPVIESMITWSTSDVAILKEVVMRCLKILSDKMPRLKFELKNHPEIHPHSRLISYDISKQPVSVHLGLSRFIAGVLAGATKNSLSLEELLRLEEKNNDERTQLCLMLMEYPLRALVFAAQVSVGMWRRNGYAVLHQISYYQNVRCVSEMYDKDIVMLQIAASLMDSDHFLTAMLDKYGLLDWLKLGFEETDLDEDAQRRIIVISEEFLLTLLAVVGERHVLGIGDVSSREILRKELIHRLALGPASRSEIVKNLPSKNPDSDEDCTFESILDDVLKSVADFREPGLIGKGLYHMKQNCLEECSQYFYHYSRSEQSKVEYDFIKALEQRRKETKKASPSAGYKVPAPANFTKNFLPVTNLFNCTKMAKVLMVVLYRAAKNDSKITPDTVIEEALHIIALGLYEEKRRRINHCEQKDSFLDIVTRTLAVVDGKSLRIQGLLQEIQAKSQNQEYGELIDWIMKFLYDESAHRNEEIDDSSQLNKRKQDEVDSELKTDKERRARLAREKREKVMAQMSQMQKSFIKKYENFLSLEDDKERDISGIETEDDFKIDKIDSVAVGRCRTIPKQKVNHVICILCQEKQDVSLGDNSIVMATFLQRSKVLSLARGKSLVSSSDYNPLFPPRDMFTGVFTSTCSHVMHSECWQKYFDAVKDKEGRQPLRLRFQRIEVHKNEYLCPLCSSLCNSVVPVFPAMAFQEAKSQEMDTDEDLSLIERVVYDLRNKLDNEGNALFHKAATASTASHGLPNSISAIRNIILNIIHQRGHELSAGTLDMVKKFSSAVENVGLKSKSRAFSSSFVMAWNTCSYTMQATESFLREKNKGIFDVTPRQTDCLSALVRYCAMSTSISDSVSEIQMDCLKILAALIPSDILDDNFPSILDLNIFATMVNLRFALQSIEFADSSLSMADLLANGSIDALLLNISMKALLVQQLLIAPEELTSVDEHYKHVASNVVKENLAKLWGKLKLCSNIQLSDEPHKQPDHLFCHIMQQCAPFIRCVALFYHFLTGVPPPAFLSDNELYEQHNPVKEAQTLCLYLSIPLDVVSILPLENGSEADLSLTEAMIERWCNHYGIREYFTKTKTGDLSLVPASLRLVPLPRDYSSLLTTAAGFRCPMTGDISQNPTICLVCGEMLCSQSYCCHALIDERQIGSCTAHADKCNETVGIFLLIRDCQILLIYNKSKGCLIPSPYLDEYGEPDIKFRRGNPLFLSSGRYDSLQKLWLSHSIPQEIVRQFDSNKTYIDWPQFL